MEKLKFLKKKKVLIPTIGLASFISWVAVIGGLIGYFLTKRLAGEQVGVSGKVKSFVLKIGSYRFHFHHWLIGASLLVLSLFDILPILQGAFSQGFFIGIIAQGIFNYPDWYKLIIK